MSLDKSLKEMKFDSRLLDINIKAGNLTKEEIKKHLDQLPDLSDKCEKLSLEETSDSTDTQNGQQH